MAKTINSKVQYFTNRTAAEKAFSKVQSAHLLAASNGFFVDESKECLSAWPKLYTLIADKDFEVPPVNECEPPAEK